MAQKLDPAELVEFKELLMANSVHRTRLFNCLLKRVSLQVMNVNLEMVKAGLAEVYRGKQPKGFDLTPYRLAEKEARDAGIGMWTLGNQYISTKDWRKMHRK